MNQKSLNKKLKSWLGCRFESKIYKEDIDDIKEILSSVSKKTRLDWEKEFQKLFLDDPYEKGIVYASGDNVKDFIQSLLSTQRQEILEEIMKLEIGEFEGWDLAKKFNCCPGDDMADAYNQALKDVIKSLKQK